jgi:hypothetical protein
MEVVKLQVMQGYRASAWNISFIYIFFVFIYYNRCLQCLQCMFRMKINYHEDPKNEKGIIWDITTTNSGDRSNQCSYLKDYVITEMGLQNLSREELRNVRNTISSFCSKLFQKWEDCRRINDRFVRENAIWLEQKEVLPVHVPVHFLFIYIYNVLTACPITISNTTCLAQSFWY